MHRRPSPPSKRGPKKGARRQQQQQHSTLGPLNLRATAKHLRFLCKHRCSCPAPRPSRLPRPQPPHIPSRPPIPHRQAGANTAPLVPTASHASSPRRGASATAGPTSGLPSSTSLHHAALIKEPEDAHIASITSIVSDPTNPPPTAPSSNPRVLSPGSQPPYPTSIAAPAPTPRSNRWSLRNAFSPLAPPPQLRTDFFTSTQPPPSSRRLLRPRTGGRLWNPTNSTPRAPRPRSPDLEAAQVLAVPVQHPQTPAAAAAAEAAASEAGGAYPLLTLQEQRQIRQSAAATPRGSVNIEYQSSASGSARISLPRSVSLDLRRSTETEGQGKDRDVHGETSTAAPGKRSSLSGPPVALKQQIEALERQEIRMRDKGKGKAREIDIAMATPDLELGSAHHAPPYSADGRAGRPTNVSATSLSQHSAQGIGLPPSSADESSMRGSAHSVVLPGEDEEWGPSHPCYPHLNPHVPISSPLYDSTRIIRIRRDWMLAGDLSPTFSGLYPEILADAGLGEGEFRRVVEDVNRQLIPAFDPWGWRNILDAALGLLTGWIWDDLGFTAIKGRLKEVERSLERWNDEIEKHAGSNAAHGMVARFMPLRKSAFMTLDIQIPTPQLTQVNPADIDDGRGSRMTNNTGRQGSQHKSLEGQGPVGGTR